MTPREPAVAVVAGAWGFGGLAVELALGSGQKPDVSRTDSIYSLDF